MKPLNYRALSSTEYKPRQFEFSPTERSILFGTLSGEVVLTSIDKEETQVVGNFGRNSHDAILGICWLRKNQDRFIIGSSKGIISCGSIVNSRIKYGDHRTDPHAIVKKYPDFDQLTSVHVNCDDTKILVSGYSKSAKVLDLESGTAFYELKNIHMSHINISRFCFSNPNILATSSFDCTAKVLK